MKNEANNLTRSIITFLRLNGHYAERINNIARQVKGRYIKSQTSRGVPDIIASINGLFIGIEIKIGKDRQSDDQKLQESLINKSGGVYFIAKDFKGFEIKYDELIAIAKEYKSRLK